MREETDSNKKENKQIKIKFEQLKEIIDEALKLAEELNIKLTPIKLDLPKVDKNLKENENVLCPFAEVINMEIIKINQIIYMLKNNLEEIQF